MRLKDEFPDTRLLIGNHEECFLSALTGDVRRLRYFMRIGGDATIRSYWCDDTSLAEASFEEVARRLPTLVPADHIDFLGSGERSEEHTSELQSLMRISYAVFCLKKKKKKKQH